MSENLGVYDKKLLKSLGVDVAQIEHLTPEELMVLEQCLSELTESDEGISATAVSLLAEDYKWEPVSMEQFLHDPFYMGSYSHEIFPGLRAAMIEIFDGKKLPSEVLLTGGIGYGKCLRADTLCPTSNGLKTIKSMALDASKGCGDKVLTHLGNVSRAAGGTHPGLSATKKIVTKWGYELEGRPEHRIKIYRDEKFVWRRLDEVKVGDLAVITADTGAFGIDDTLNPAQAEALGVFTGDGHYEASSVHITVGRNEAEWLRVAHSHMAALRTLTRTDNPVQSHLYGGRSYRVSVHSHDLVARIRELGFETGSFNKKVPLCILRAPKDVQCAFIRGMYDTDGTVSSKSIDYCTVSETLAYQLQAMLLNMGILCNRRLKQCKYVYNGVTQRRPAWVIHVRGKGSRENFARDIGFKHPKRAQRLAVLLKDTRRNSKKPNDGDVLYDVSRLLAGYIKPCARKKQPHVQRDTVVRYVEKLGEKAHPIAQDIVKRSLSFLPITSITDSEADCWDISVPGDESYVANGFLSHNTTISAVMLAYNAYRVTCLHDPHTYYKLAKGSAIYFGIYSLSLDQAMDGMYGKVIHHIDRIPYFDQRCPRVKRTNSEIKFSTSPLRIIFGSKSEHIIGRDLLNFACDEINFFEGGDEQKPGELTPVEKLYVSALRRIQTRFPDGKGGSLGMTILASSRASKVSFLDRHIKESAEAIRKGDTKLMSFATWEVRPASQYKLPRFTVEVGDRLYPPRVLKDGEEPRNGAETVQVPGEFREIFERDVAAGLRDIAGVSTESMMPLIHDKSAIEDCACAEHAHPFTREELVIDLRDDTRIDQYFLPERMFYVSQSRYTMRLNPQSPRYVHIDIGYVSDALGVAMSHIAGFRVGKVLRRDGTWYEDKIPIVVNDFTLRVVPPPGSETNISCVRSFLLSLRDYGVPIRLVTADSHQSRSELQILKKMGFDTAPLSVDQHEDAYLAFRQAIMERRWVMYHYPTLMRELRELERDIDKRKVDHPAISPETGGPGGKDCADGACGSYFAAITDKRQNIQAILDTLPIIGDKPVGELLSDLVRPTKRPIRHVPVPGGEMLWKDLEKDVR